ncbi:transcription-repair coupling factor [Treponema pallidum]|uniref:Transcription-repair-coupling factor n=5 Tax=Treponema pallidum TaxID=160 RepID=O83364_TREPA|nr:transcription-repair coupling factor [Treponema pallidum]AAC65332.1 transcription-repair coupling factor (trcF) [Treponema pallidum subsp. pallidum str. Nichols]ACD70770.1 transcription-repair coupling factor [Treponema pallidum subsp. pallidum SS14]AEZ60660.1 transcription-repair coupling factor [Treponema pallidum subsp. pallidum DAL-1]AFU66353.1 transcription-repair coupling factor [Treponema pallidum subsp. pallidum str. Mexico A]AGN75542.1 transcription-repair coupling factor [Treponem
MRGILHSWNELQHALRSLRAARFPYRVEGCTGGLRSYFFGEYVRTCCAHIVLVVPTEQDVAAVCTDLAHAAVPTRVLPWWGSLPYRPVSPNAHVFSHRVEALCALAQRDATAPCAFVFTQRALLTPVPPLDYVRTLKRSFRVGEHIEIHTLAAQLMQWGYARVDHVSACAEFSLRGEILDIAAAAQAADNTQAYRIVCDFNTIERIHILAVSTCAVLQEVSACTLYAAKEILWSEERIAFLHQNLQKLSECPAHCVPCIEELTHRKTYEGEEMFYPLCFERPTCVLEYFRHSPSPPSVFYLDYERQHNGARALQDECRNLYHKMQLAHEHVPARWYPQPEHIVLDFSAVCALHLHTVYFTHFFPQLPACESICLASDPARSFFGNIPYFKEELLRLSKDGWHVFVFAESEQQALRIRALVKGCDVTVLPCALSAGFSIPALKILIVQEGEIFGRRRKTPQSVQRARSTPIDTFVELNPGDYVVHAQYGIGLFKGIERIKTAQSERDYVNLLYAQEETILIPIEQAHLVQRYIGNEGNKPHLDSLGSKSWETRKARVKKSVENIAQKLVELYSLRKTTRGHAFPKDDEWQYAFEAAFPYEETDDQRICIEEVKQDMQEAVPMDRLVCGDVGYGKTEIAMRAAFKAVMGGKQVVFLTPTTLLVEQHFRTICNRFKHFPVRIEKLSRFVPKSEQKDILAKLAHGDIDLIVGTHRLIQKDVSFKDLGLMILDEEQRFGVQDKEKLKQMKTNVDCLSLSATPIPRTLHMGMLKIRDMSLLTTPPEGRLPIETVIQQFDPNLVATAIRKELDREGQIFYLHNRIENLESVKCMLQKLVPELSICVAHSLMGSEELEDIFERFYQKTFQLLLSTTIIENGIDVPNANTIIIDRADMYGVSQLYQLRGRVGRSDKKAYAYLLYYHDVALSDLAIKRLQVISDFTDLGAGFKVALKDMEIRGVGNLLGKEQSGDIYSVGFDLYVQLLEEAIERLQHAPNEQRIETVIDLNYRGFIPHTYIAADEIKMELYKKIAAAHTHEELERIRTETITRFGPIPEEAAGLFTVAEIKVRCEKLAILSLKETHESLLIEFDKVCDTAFKKILRLVQTSNDRVRLDAKQPNMLILTSDAIEIKEKGIFICEILKRLES